MFNFANQTSQANKRGQNLSRGGPPTGLRNYTRGAAMSSTSDFFRPAVEQDAPPSSGFTGFARQGFVSAADRGSSNNAPKNYTRGGSSSGFGAAASPLLQPSENTSAAASHWNQSFGPRGGSGSNMIPLGRGRFNQNSTPNNNDEIRENAPPSSGFTGFNHGGFASRNGRGNSNNAPKNYTRGGSTSGFGATGSSTFQPFENKPSVFQPNQSFNPLGASGSNMMQFGRGGFNQGSAPNNNNEIQESAPPADKPVDLVVLDDDKLVFGEDIQEKFVGHKLPRNRAEAGYAPVARGVDEIFDEDDKYAADYAAVANEDDEVEVTGLRGKLISINTWEDLKLEQRLLGNVERAKYRRPRNIQCAAIPIILHGYDLICISETGSGKTLSYLLPILERCIDDKRIRDYASKPFVPYAVILQPTRELSLQCFEQAIKFADGTGITVAKAYGEYSVQKNREELFGTCDILIATPKRFKDFCSKKYIILNECRFLVFDEGDQLLGDDFKKTIDDGILCSNPKIAPNHQTLVFSATFNDYALMNAKGYMRGGQGVVHVKNKVSAPSKKCEQVFKVITNTGKYGVVLNYLRAEFGKVEKDAQPRTIIFCDSRQYCEKLAIGLEVSGIIALPLSGLRGQDLREESLKKFRDGEVKILCISDVGSRGLDVKDVDLVVQFDMARRYEVYVNRVGRTGRIRHGKCVSFVDLEKDRQVLYEIKRAMEDAGQDIPQSLHDAVGDFNPRAGFGFKNLNKIASASVANETVKPTTSSAPIVEEVPAQVVKGDSATEDSIERMKKAMKEAGIADDVIESTVALAHLKPQVAATDASTHKAAPNIPEPGQDKKSVPPLQKSVYDDSDDGW